MESWPTVAWILLLTNIADWLKIVQSRDFTMKDIILLHPSICSKLKGAQSVLHIDFPGKPHGPASTATPHPGGFKCFTCQDAADNYECNRWAPDVYCPKGTRYCYTLHMMDKHGDSVSVTKRCVTLESCLFTGCAHVTDNGYRVCSSCCEGNICNLLVPKNESSAIFSSASPLVSSSTGLHPATLSYIVISILTARHV